MAYLIFTANGEEYDRRELVAPLTLGRAPECNVSMPDITLSRRHCRIEPSENGNGWQIVDLQSKNGTHFRGRPVEQHVLRDEDEVRIGRTRLTFRAGAFVPAAGSTRRPGVIRPSDPTEALAGTVTGMVLCEPDEVERHEGMPIPRPRPADPSAYVKEDLYGMLNEIASSSWDSIMAQNSQPVRMQRAMPVPAVTHAHRGSVRPKPRVAFYLQAEHREQPVPPLPAPAAASVKRQGAASRLGGSLRNWWLAATSVLATLIFVTAWVTLILRAAPTGDAAPAGAAPQEIREPSDAGTAIIPVPSATMESDTTDSAIMGSATTGSETPEPVITSVITESATSESVITESESTESATTAADEMVGACWSESPSY